MTDAFTRLVAVSFSPRGLRVAIPAAIAGIVLAGAVFAAVEDRSLGDGLWWSFVTVTTVGYGDVTPATTGGKVVAITLMVGGIGFLLMLAGALVQHFVTVEVEEREVLLEEHEVLRRIDDLSAKVDALARELEAARRQ